MFANPKTSYSKLLTSWGHVHRMLKASNRKFWDPQTSDSKLLKSWVLSQDVKVYDLDVCGSKNNKIDVFSIKGHGPQGLKISNRRFLIPKLPIQTF